MSCLLIDADRGPETVVLFPVFTLVFGCLINLVVRKSKHIGLQFTVVLLLSGAIVGYSACIFDFGDLESSLYYWMRVDPPILIFFIFLPPLLFEGSAGLEWYYVRRSTFQIIILAFVLVFINSFVIGFTIIYVFGIPWKLSAGFLFGALLSATDPIAVVAVLKEAGASKPLRTIIEGEALLNDGSAFVLFDIFLKLLVNPSLTVTPAIILSDSLRLTGGGILVGLTLGLIACYIFAITFKEQQAIITLSLGMAYLTFYIAQRVLDVSGAIAVVTLGFVMSAYGLSYIRTEILEGFEVFWDVLTFLTNTIVFFYGGAVGVYIIFIHKDNISLYDVLLIPVLYVLLHVLRALGLFIFHPLLNATGYRINKAEAILITCSGLRGTLSLVMVLMVHYSLQNEDPVVYMDVVPRLSLWTTSIVFMTLVINGSFFETLMQKTGIMKASDAKQRIFANAKHHLDRQTTAVIEALRSSARFSKADWNAIIAFFESTVHPNEITRKESKRALKDSKLHLKEKAPAKALAGPQATTSMAQLKPFNIERSISDVCFDTPSQILKRVDSDASDNNLTQSDDVDRLTSVHNMANDDEDFDMHQNLMDRERRRRVLFSIRLSVHKQVERGFLDPAGIRVLNESIARSLDHPEVPIQIFHSIERDIGQIGWLEKIVIEKNVKSLRKLAVASIYQNLSLALNVCSAYWAAISSFKKSWVKGAVECEIDSERRLVSGYLNSIECHYPEIVAIIHSRHATLAVLRSQALFVEKLKDQGGLEDSEAKELFQEIDDKEEKVASIFNLSRAFKPATLQEAAMKTPFLACIMGTPVFDALLQTGYTRVFNKGEEVVRAGTMARALYLTLQGSVVTKERLYQPNIMKVATESDTLFLRGLEAEDITAPVLGGLVGVYSIISGTPSWQEAVVESPSALLYAIPELIVQRILRTSNDAKKELYLIAAELALRRLSPELNVLMEGSHLALRKLDSEDTIGALTEFEAEEMIESESDGGVQDLSDKALLTGDQMALYILQNLRNSEIIELSPRQERNFGNMCGVLIKGSIQLKPGAPFRKCPLIFAIGSRNVVAGPSGASIVMVE